MRKLIRKMIELQIDKDLIEAVVSLCSTEEQYDKMSQALDTLENLTTTTILGKAILISEQEDGE